MQLRQSVIELLTDLLGEHAGTPDELDAALTVPPKPEMGDLAFPCFPLAKALRKAPPLIAKELAEQAASMLPRGGARRRMLMRFSSASSEKRSLSTTCC